MVLITMLMGAFVGFLAGLVGWLGLGMSFGTAIAIYFGMSFAGAGVGILSSLARSETSVSSIGQTVLPSTANSF